MLGKGGPTGGSYVMGPLGKGFNISDEPKLVILEIIIGIREYMKQKSIPGLNDLMGNLGVLS